MSGAGRAPTPCAHARVLPLHERTRREGGRAGQPGVKRLRLVGLCSDCGGVVLRYSGPVAYGPWQDATGEDLRDLVLDARTDGDAA